MRNRVLIITISVIMFVIGGMIVEVPLTSTNLVLLVIIGIIVGVINSGTSQQTNETEPKASTFVDKILDHPILFVVNGIVVGWIIGAPVGKWLGNQALGWIIGGVIGLISSVVWILKYKDNSD